MLPDTICLCRHNQSANLHKNCVTQMRQTFGAGDRGLGAVDVLMSTAVACYRCGGTKGKPTGTLQLRTTNLQRGLMNVFPPPFTPCCLGITRGQLVNHATSNKPVAMCKQLHASRDGNSISPCKSETTSRAIASGPLSLQGSYSTRAHTWHTHHISCVSPT